MNQARPVINRDDQAVLANISDQEFFSNQATMGSYTLPAKPPGERYALLAIFGRWEFFDLGDGRKGEKYWTAEDIARSVLAEHNPDADLRRFGVFLCAGARPTEYELSAAQARQDSFYLEQIQQADITYSREPHRPDSITDVQRRAARALGIDRPWLVKLAPMSECPACGGQVKPGAAVCRHCRTILDADKAAKFGIVRPAAAASTANEAPPTHEPVPPCGTSATSGWASRIAKKK